MDMLKWTISISLIWLMSLGIIAGNAQINVLDVNSIIIDDMKSLKEWHSISDPTRDCSVDMSIVDDGLKISYKLNENESWVDVYKEIDFAKIPEIDKLSFKFNGVGAPNTLEFKLDYEDGSEFGYEYNVATNTGASISLYPWQITYWWKGKQHPKTEPVDFSKVKTMRFAISNNPDKNDVLGNGFIIIGGVFGEKKTIPPGPSPIVLAAIVTGIFSIAAIVIKIRRKSLP